jgi:serine acetyltransferase
LVNKDIPSNSIAVGNPCKVIKQKQNYLEDVSKMIFNKKTPKKFDDFLNNKAQH